MPKKTARTSRSRVAAKSSKRKVVARRSAKATSHKVVHHVHKDDSQTWLMVAISVVGVFVLMVLIWMLA